MGANSTRRRLNSRSFSTAALLFSLIISSPCVTLALSSSLEDATVTVDAGKVVGKISPLLYGQFLEFMFEGVKGGLYAELIRNRSFEEPANAIGLSRDWERYPDDRDDDYGLSFLWDDSFSYPANHEAPKREHSLRVDAGDGVIQRHGVYQGRVPVRAGIDYHGYLWAKTEQTGGYEGRISVALESEVPGQQPYAEAKLQPVSGDWKKYEFTLRPQKGDAVARLAVLFYGTGRVWVDQISLMPGDAVDGVRRDVFDRVKAVRPAFIRWPGGNVAQDYHWPWGVGPREQRTTWTNMSWKNESEPSDFGTDEFVRFSRNVGAEPSLTINVEGRGATVEEAAAWVEYCNGPATSKYGNLRASNGHVAPYRVKYWELGNEIWGDWVRGHSDAETYARNYNRYASAMRRVDPAIKLIAVGDNDMKWNRTVLRDAGNNIDYLAIHHYYGRREMSGDRLNLMARPLFYERFYRTVRDLILEVAPQRPIKLAINEWGLDLLEPQQYSMLSALYGARLLNVFERSGDIVELSAVSDLVNGWPGGIIQAARYGLFVSPLYLVNQIYSENQGTELLATQVHGPTFDSTHEGKQVPVLDTSVSRSSDGRWIFLKLVNTALKQRLVTTINVQGVRLAPRAEMVTVSAPTPASSNSFSTPNAISLKRGSIRAGNKFIVSLQGPSVSVIKLQVKKRRLDAVAQP
jgi:alpha-N-arabinofuranosidase